MKVKELRNILEFCDGEAEVLLPGLDGAYWSDDPMRVITQDVVPVNSSICTHVEATEAKGWDVTGPAIRAVCIS